MVLAGITVELAMLDDNTWVVEVLGFHRHFATFDLAVAHAKEVLTKNGYVTVAV